MRINELDGQLALFAPALPCGKTCPDATTPRPTGPRRARTSGRSSRRSSVLRNHTLMLLDLRPGAGNMLGPCWEYDPAWLGPPGRLNTSECPRDAEDVSLSSILLDTVPSKYYLSRKACLGILRRSGERGKPLPLLLELALKLQAGIIRPPPGMAVSQFLEAKGAFAAGFSAGAGASARSVGYQEEVSPTLKASQSGSMMPSVLCLNDQGGEAMACSEDVTGTLRAQEHGHQPLVFENHGIDARYRGPLSVAPTMSARYGTGGLNTPLITSMTEKENRDSGSDGPAFFLIRRLHPTECERLQGYPDGWTALPGASDSARYRALGNSVAVPCVEYLMRGIALALRAGL